MQISAARHKVAEADGWRRAPTLGSAQWARLWRLAYRFDGKQKLLALGIYPTITLAKARQAREDARRLLADGLDPASEKKRRLREGMQAATFRAMAKEYVAKLKREGRVTATIAKTEWLLGFAYSAFGDTPIKAVDAATILSRDSPIDQRIARSLVV
jgi:hypothetical protein